MKTINTLSELHAERLRLKVQQSRFEKEIISSVEDIRNELSSYMQPLKTMKDSAGKLLINDSHGIVPDVIGSLVNLIGRKLIFRNAGIVTKFVLPYMMRNLTSNFIGKNKDKILIWALELFSGSANKEKSPLYDKGTVNADY